MDQQVKKSKQQLVILQIMILWIKRLSSYYWVFIVITGGGKKGKKKKGQTVSLNEFLGDTPTYSPAPTHSKSSDWGDENDDLGPVDCKFPVYNYIFKKVHFLNLRF